MSPYDNRVGLWHHWGYTNSQMTIDDFAKQLKQRAPAVTAIYVKTHHGAKWQSTWDKSPNLAISGPASVDQWVQTLSKYNIEFHAWCVPQGLDIAGEAQRIIDVCARPGVKSMIMDVEPFQDFYTGGPSTIRPLMTKVKASIPASFHLAISVDPRSRNYASIFPAEWFPFVGSVLPQCYWETFGSDPAATLKMAYDTWKGFGRPIYPVLQVASTVDRMKLARSTAVQIYKALGVSWWQMNDANDARWPGININLDGTVPTTTSTGSDTSNPLPETTGGTTPVAGAIVVKTTDAGYHDGTYDGSPIDKALKSFTDTAGNTAKYKATSNAGSTVWARWDPQLKESRYYEVAAFIPGTNATTLNARYKLHNTEGKVGELEVPIAQDRFYDSWVPLGTYFFRADDDQAGVIFLNDYTKESNRLIAFDAIRWRPVSGPSSDFKADGFDAPIGTGIERAGTQVWPGRWFDATGYDVLYNNNSAYHTGADLNLNYPTWDSDALSPVVAAASGVVTTSARFTVWGWIIVIRHDPLITTGQVVYARYAHVTNPIVKVGQRVQRGEQIANVGNADGTQPYHLHFDISPTDILNRVPSHWPKLNRAALLENYIDPRDFVRKNRPRS